MLAYHHVTTAENPKDQLKEIRTLQQACADELKVSADQKIALLYNFCEKRAFLLEHILPIFDKYETIDATNLPARLTGIYEIESHFMSIKNEVLRSNPVATRVCNEVLQTLSQEKIATGTCKATGYVLK